jgi:hypothetical protein
VIAEDLLEGVFVDSLPCGCHRAWLYHVLAPRSTRLCPLLRSSLPLVSPCRDRQKGGFSKRKFLYAELIELLFDWMDWMNDTYVALLQGKTRPPEPPNRMRAIQWLYFPKLHEPFQALTQALVPCIELFEMKSPTDVNASSDTRRKFYHSRFVPLYEDFCTAWTTALDAVVAAVPSHALRLLRRHTHTKDGVAQAIPRAKRPLPP